MRYFNYAGLSPTRVEAIEETRIVADEFRALLFCESGIAWYRKQVENCRQKVAQLLHVNLDEGGDSLVFVPNTTTAYRLALAALEFHQGDVIITSDQEHSSTLQALHSLTQGGIELIVIPARSEESFLTQLDDVCQGKKTRLITLSHVAHTDGRVFPLRQVCEIADRRHVLLAIDGAQAIGHVPVDLGTLNVDFYFFSGHKWCAGPMGTGALLITRRHKERIASRESGLPVTGSPQGWFDLGTQNIGLIAGLARACEMKQQELPAMSELAGLRTVLRGCLSRMNDVDIAEWDGPHAPGILSFQVHKAGFDASRIAEYLHLKYDIAIKPLRYPGSPQLLRVSWSLSTEVQDILFLAEKLDEALELHTAG
ncbi:MAG: aminotransferase class V-fold PLP-dependent enzyme [Nitrospira sp.]|nr:aminotransferase class V-fold PLP-dependent enzyme [Nitrospira sp.]